MFKGLWKFDEDNDDTIPDPAEVRRRRKLVDYRDVLVDEARRHGRSCAGPGSA